jgi:uncharacterized protein with FMN-binding domain
MNQSHNNNTPKIVGAIVISAILLIGVYTLLIKKSNTSANLATTTTVQSAETTEPVATTTTDTTATATTPAADTTTANQASTYKDGTYTKTVNYQIPGGDSNQLTAKITISGDTITAVTASAKYSEQESRQYVNGFESSINSAVKGKKLANTFIGRVGGASLTSGAFNDIVDLVKKDAKA